ncbi:DJ-1/PfpI family protein, partial [Mitosporidium daphniae]
MGRNLYAPYTDPRANSVRKSTKIAYWDTECVLSEFPEEGTSDLSDFYLFMSSSNENAISEKIDDKFPMQGDATDDLRRSPVLTVSDPKISSMPLLSGLISADFNGKTEVFGAEVCSYATTANVDIVDGNSPNRSLNGGTELQNTFSGERQASCTKSIEKKKKRAKKEPVSPTIRPDPSCFMLTRDGYYYDYRTAYYYQFDRNCNMYFPISAPSILSKGKESVSSQPEGSIFACLLCKKSFSSQRQLDIHKDKSEIHKVTRPFSPLEQCATLYRNREGQKSCCKPELIFWNWVYPNEKHGVEGGRGLGSQWQWNNRAIDANLSAFKANPKSKRINRISFLEPHNMSQHSKSLLVILTNSSKLSHESEPSPTSHVTGFDIKEVAYIYMKLTKNFKAPITFATPRGGEAPIDPSSRKEGEKDEIVREFLRDSSLQSMFRSTTSLDEIRPEDYFWVLIPGKHGAMMDLSENSTLRRILSTIYNDNQGYIATIGHGVSALLCCQTGEGSSKFGPNFLKNRSLTGPTNEEESMLKMDKLVPYLIEDRLRECGAKFEKESPFKPFVVVDERLVTGQNCNSVNQWIEHIIDLCPSHRKQ